MRAEALSWEPAWSLPSERPARHCFYVKLNQDDLDNATSWHRHSPETSDISQKAPQRQADFLDRCRTASSHWDDSLSRCPQCQGRQTSYRRACPAAASIQQREKARKRETVNLSEVLEAKYKPVLFAVIINRLIHDSHCT